MRRDRKIPCPALLLCATLTACGTADGDGPPDGIDTDALWAELEACGLTGAHRVELAASGCEDWPRQAESIAVTRDDDAIWLRAGLVELPLRERVGECHFVAAGCEQTSTASEQERYFAPELALRSTANGVQITARATDVVDTWVGPCTDAAFEAAPIPACDLLGTWIAESDAAITDGACDLAWRAGEVTVSAEAGVYSVDWAGTTVDDLVLDETTCTLRGARGQAPSSFWSYNGAMRTAVIELSFADGVARGNVADLLDGTTFDELACPGATFALQAARPADRDARPLAASCEAPPPPACGNAICEDGESCFCSDCACDGAQECAPDGVCRAACALESEATDCAAGERCSPFGSSGVAIFPSDRLFCAPAGSLQAGESCGDHGDCAAGLICHISQEGTRAMCAPPCGEGFAECVAPEICGVQGDGSGNGWYPTAARACERLAQIGEDCVAATCDDSLFCMQSCIDGVCEDFCSKYCSSSSDCPPELPVCHWGGACTKS